MRLHRTIILAVAFAAAPALWAATPSPALLVLNKEGSLAIVNPATGAVTGRVPTGEDPHEVAASTDGKFAFASNYGSARPGSEGHTISVIDLAAQKEIHRFDLTPLRRPHGLYSQMASSTLLSKRTKRSDATIL